MDLVRVHKHYWAPFIVDKSKLTRLHDVITENLREVSANHVDKAVVILAKERAVETAALADVFTIVDNRTTPHRDPAILMRGSIRRGGESPEHEVRIEIDGSHPADLSASVHSTNQKWAMATLAKVEEQLERTLQRSLIPRLLNKRDFKTFAFLIAMVLLTSGLLSAAMLIDRSSFGRTQTMWLTAGDLQEFEELTKRNGGVLSAEQISRLVARQVKNVAEKERTALTRTQWATFRSFSLGVPVIVVVGSLVYMAAYCYPRAVFLWGDREEWYRSLVTRRRTIWGIIVFSMIIGVLSNLFAWGVTSGG